MWLSFRGRYALHYETHPVPAFRVDHKDLPVQIEQGVEGRVSLHLL